MIILNSIRLYFELGFRGRFNTLKTTSLDNPFRCRPGTQLPSLGKNVSRLVPKTTRNQRAFRYCDYNKYAVDFNTSS